MCQTACDAMAKATIFAGKSLHETFSKRNLTNLKHSCHVFEFDENLLKLTVSVRPVSLLMRFSLSPLLRASSTGSRCSMPRIYGCIFGTLNLTQTTVEVVPRPMLLQQLTLEERPSGNQ